MNWRNTWVIFTSDHGEMLGDHYRYHKSVGYEGAARIPLLIAGPETPALQVRDEPVGWHDLLPTILDVAGTPVPDNVDGRSLAPLIRGEAAQDWRQWVAGESLWHITSDLPGQKKDGNLYYEGGHHFITDGHRKLLWHPNTGA